jgi:hypothetical protein
MRAPHSKVAMLPIREVVSETDNVAAGRKSQAQVLLEHVAVGVTTTTELAKAMGVSKGRISHLTTQLLTEKRLVRRDGVFSLPKTRKFIADFAPSVASQPAPPKDLETEEQKPTTDENIEKFRIPNSCELVNAEIETPIFFPEQKAKPKPKIGSEPLFFSALDWRDFLDLGTLPRKAGCSPGDLPRIVYKEAADNACDAGETVSLGDWTDPKGNRGVYFSDDGPGLDPEQQVPLIFSINRARFSSKHIRRVSRGILGNGSRVIAGVVAATGGTLMVETRARRVSLEMDMATGIIVPKCSEPIPFKPGLTLYLALGRELALGESDHLDLAKATIRISRYGHVYSGASSPWFYGPHDFFRLIQEAHIDAMTFVTLARKCGFVVSGIIQPAWQRLAKELSFAQIQEALEALRDRNKRIAPKRIGHIGPEAFAGTHYAKELGVARLDGAELPYCIEAWARCQRPVRKGNGRFNCDLLVNRSMTATKLHGISALNELTIHGCDLNHFTKHPPKTGDYSVTLSIIAPYLPLTTEGKEPALKHLVSPILDAICKAARKAHGALERPEQTKIKDAAWEIMEEAYLNTSDNGELPANARQIMYAARPYILQQTGLDSFGDQYFTQTLLPDYVEKHPEQTADWDVVFDARGNATEPHTGHKIPLGTLAVRDYLGQIRSSGKGEPNEVIDLPPLGLFPTIGPLNRFRYVLFVEKEGFGPLLAAGQIQEKYDLFITSTKGLSVTALRELLDALYELGVEKVFVLHDFDISGFSILGTLGKSNRRYHFANKIEVVDLGLRLTDVQAEQLQSEPIPLKKDPDKQEQKWAAQALTLARHGASPEEIEFLRTRRSELNMLSGRRFLDFLERKLRAHGVSKYIPDEATLLLHLSRFYQWQLTKELLNAHREDLKARAAAMPMPEDLRSTVLSLLVKHPEWPWDKAVTELLTPGPAKRPGVTTPLD